MRVLNRSCSTRNNSSPTATERLGDTGLWLVEAPGQREVVFIWSHPMSILVVLCVGGLAIFAALMTPGTAGGLILAAVTAFFGYILAAIVFNRTHIRIDAEVLSVRHGPVPWPGNKDLRNSDIVALRAHRKRDNEGTDRPRGRPLPQRRRSSIRRASPARSGSVRSRMHGSRPDPKPREPTRPIPTGDRSWPVAAVAKASTR